MKLSHQVPNIPVASREHDRGSVVAARDVCAQAGIKMYEKGGNAVDAAVAAALVAGVVEPTETTLAGCGFILLHHPTEGAISVDFGPLAPRAAGDDMYEIDTSRTPSNVLGLTPVKDNANVTGPRAPGVPRTLYALLETQARWGRLTRQEVLAPAIEAAQEGFEADGWFVVNALQDLELLAKDPGCAQTFLDADGLPKGRRSAVAYGRSIDIPPRVTQHQLARTLQRVADRGSEDLVTGETARLLVETFAKYNMLLDAEDLKRMAPRIEKPRTLRFRGALVSVPNAPGGGITVLEALNTWQHLVPRDAVLDRATYITLLSRVLKNSFADRYHWLGDPEHRDIPVDALLSSEYAAAMATSCREPLSADLGNEAPWTYFSKHALNNPWPFDPAGRSVAWSPKGSTEPSSGTTHVSAVDGDGWVVAITHTAANHFGSAILCPRTGLLFDSTMAWFNAQPGAANSILPGGRPVANMAPALIMNEATGAVHAVGASGGRRIISAVTQLVIEIVEQHKTAAEALAVPRIDSSGLHTIMHEFDAGIAAAVPELDARLVSQHSLPFELDFARANIAEFVPGRNVRTAIEARAYDR